MFPPHGAGICSAVVWRAGVRRRTGIHATRVEGAAGIHSGRVMSGARVHGNVIWTRIDHRAAVGRDHAVRIPRAGGCMAQAAEVVGKFVV